MSSEQDHGSCAVCAQLATLKCGNCKSVYYCKKDHQRDDWPRHKTVCRAYEIRESKELGRHLIAARDLRAGDVVVSELPLVWGPAPHKNHRVCVGCGRQCVNDDAWCSRCMWPACSSRCSGLTDNNKHGLECNIIIKARLMPRCDVLLALRMLILWHSGSKRWAALEKLQSHEESRGPGTTAFEEVQDVAEHLQPLFAIDSRAKDTLMKICGLIDVNALETNPPEGSAAIYEIACLLEHNCMPNTRHSFTIDDKGRPRIVVKVVTDVKRGEHLSTMYTHALWSTRVRREHLLATKYFSCRCKRCADPTELGTHMSTLKCPCGNGLLLPKDPLNSETEWSCNACPGVLSSLEVADLTNRLEEDVEEALITGKREALSNLLSRLTVLLHPGHQHCFAVGHSLMQLLSPDDPQKAELCKQIIETVTVLDPFGARLPLYAAIALRELATCPGEDKRTLMSRGVFLLKFDPPNSPGEKLRKLLESDLLSS